MKVEKREKKEVKGGFLSLSGKQITIFLLEFLAVSAIFLAVWYYIGKFYQDAIFFFAKHILLSMGYTPVQVSALDLSDAYLGNFNLVPLIALAIATPKLMLRKRFEMLAVGVPLLFLLHVLDLVAHLPYFLGSELARFVVYSIGVGGVAMPFIIWFAINFSFLKKGLSKTFS
ncbi:MAG: hypothetical protein WBC40_00250 [Halobacteriota archaeon]